MPSQDPRRDKALEDISRSLKQIERILETMNNNMIAISKIFESQDSKSPYTMRHLPYLDKFHEDMGMSGWWMRSEERQHILNTPDE